jgi:hypothetical protein
MHRWMDHRLYGIQNGIMSEAMADIQRPDGTWVTDATWPAQGTQDVNPSAGPAGHADLHRPPDAERVGDDVERGADEAEPAGVRHAEARGAGANLGHAEGPGAVRVQHPEHAAHRAARGLRRGRADDRLGADAARAPGASVQRGERRERHRVRRAARDVHGDRPTAGREPRARSTARTTSTSALRARSFPTGRTTSSGSSSPTTTSSRRATGSAWCSSPTTAATSGGTPSRAR